MASDKNNKKKAKSNKVAAGLALGIGIVFGVSMQKKQDSEKNEE